MKNIIYFLIILPLFCNAESITISKNELVGNWVSHYGFGVSQPPGATLNSLNISNTFNSTFSRQFSSGTSQSFTAPNSDLKLNNDIFTITFSQDNQLRYKLVFSGWVNGDRKLLFGTLYLYDNGEIFNGIPVSFKPDNS